MVQIGKSRPFSRRAFLAGCSACALCARSRASAAAVEPGAGEKAKVRLVFSHPDPKIEGWPYQGYDYEGRKSELTSRLRSQCPEVEFLPASAGSAEAAQKCLEAGRDVDAYLVYLLGIPSDAPQVFAYSGRPTILVDDLYGGTGGFLGVYAEARHRGLPVVGVASTDFNDVVAPVRAVACMKRLRSSVILDVVDRRISQPELAIRETLGPEIRAVTSAELNAAYDGADRSEARKWAKTWIDNAEKVVEPSAEEIERSGVMYVAMRDLMREHKAQGIAVDCLRLFYGGKLPAYPCLGFFQLNNDGLVGACEADLQSASSMLLVSYLEGRPGYISDPVIDTSKNQLIYAHCVAPTKMFGPQGASNPYHIRSHSEDRKGAAIRSLLPLGQMTTTFKFVPHEKILVIHQGRSVANIDEDKACRTKLAVEVKDARAMAEQWRWGWHRVTAYGDLKVPMETIATLLGYKVVEEG